MAFTRSGFRVAVTYTVFSVFFDKNNLIIIGHGFQKKTQKIPGSEIDRAEKIKKEYYAEKKSDKP